jgi:putative inorganic carbon (HCO3(-)) transporter
MARNDTPLPIAAESVLSVFLGGSVAFLLFFWLLPLSVKWFAFSAASIVGIGALALLRVAALPESRRRLLLFLTIASLPLSDFTDINFGFIKDYPFYVPANGFNVNLTDLLLAIVFFGWVGDLWSGRVRLHFPRPLLLLFAGMLGIHLVSAVFVANEPFFSYSLIWRQIKAYGTAMFLANYLEDEEDFKAVSYGFTFILGFEALAVLDQLTIKTLFTPEQLGGENILISRAGAGTIARYAGTFAHPNVLGVFLATVIIWEFFLIRAETRPWHRLMFIVATIGGIGSLLTTGARGAWLGLAVALLLGIWLWPPGVRMIRNHPLATIGVMVLTVGLGVSVMFVSSETFRVRLLVGDAGTAAMRKPLMDVALNMIRDHPWTGLGLGQYGQNMLLYDRTLERLASWYLYPVHNAFLFKGAETGLPGMVVLTMIFPVVIYYGWWVFRHGTGVLAVSGLTAAGGMLCWFVQQQVNIGELHLSGILWVVTGVMLAARKRLLEPSLSGALSARRSADHLAGRTATATAVS